MMAVSRMVSFTHSLDLALASHALCASLYLSCLSPISLCCHSVSGSGQCLHLGPDWPSRQMLSLCAPAY